MLKLIVLVCRCSPPAMPPAKLDDVSHLSDLLSTWGSPANLHASLIAAGFDTVGKLAFAVTDGDAAGESAFLHKVIDPSGGSDPATLLTASSAMPGQPSLLSRRPPLPAWGPPLCPPPPKSAPCSFGTLRRLTWLRIPGRAAHA